MYECVRVLVVCVCVCACVCVRMYVCTRVFLFLSQKTWRVDRNCWDYMNSCATPVSWFFTSPSIYLKLAYVCKEREEKKENSRREFMKRLLGVLKKGNTPLMRAPKIGNKVLCFFLSYIH